MNPAISATELREMAAKGTQVVLSGSPRNQQGRQFPWIQAEALAAAVRDNHRVGVAESGEARYVQTRLDGEDHARLDDGVIVQIEEGMLMTLQSEGVPGVVPDQARHVQGVLNVAAHLCLDLGTRAAGAQRGETHVLRLRFIRALTGRDVGNGEWLRLA